LRIFSPFAYSVLVCIIPELPSRSLDIAWAGLSEFGSAALVQDAPADADSKIAALRGAGAVIAPSPHLVGVTTRDLVARRAACMRLRQR
jgi:hypothetical protein